jgi:hypothetical protein
VYFHDFAVYFTQEDLVEAHGFDVVLLVDVAFLCAAEFVEGLHAVFRHLQFWEEVFEHG